MTRLLRLLCAFVLLLTGPAVAAPGPVAVSSASTAQSTPRTDLVADAAARQSTLSEAATQLTSVLDADRRFLAQSLAKMKDTVASPLRERADQLLAEEEETLRGLRALSDGLADLARQRVKLGAEAAKAAGELEAERAASAAALRQLLGQSPMVERLAEDELVARLELDAARQHVSLLEAEAERVVAAHNRARADAAALTSPLGLIGSLAKRALSVAVPAPQSGADWLNSYIDRRRKELDEFKSALVQERAFRSQLEQDVAYHKLELARAALQSRELEARTLAEALEQLRRQVGVTADEVRKTEAAARQAHAEAVVQKAAAEKTAELAREEKDAAATAETRVRQRQAELERARTSGSADDARLSARAAILEEEARVAEDRKLLAAEREQLAALEAELARAKELQASEQTKSIRKIFEAVQESLAHPERTARVELQYKASLAASEAAAQDLKKLREQQEASRLSRSTLARRVATLAERSTKEDRTSPLLKPMQEDLRALQDRERNLDSILAAQLALQKVHDERAKFFADTLSTLSHYRRDAQTRVSAVSLAEGYESLVQAWRRARDEIESWPGQFSLYVSRPENRWSLLRGAALVGLLLGAAALVFTGLRRPGERLAATSGPFPKAAILAGLDALGPLLVWAAAAISVNLAGPGPWRAFLADPFLYVAFYRLIRWPMARYLSDAAQAPGPRARFGRSACRWGIWALRYGLIFAILENGLAQSGASRTLRFLASAARNVGLLGTVLAFLTVERQALGAALEVSAEGKHPNLRRMYNQAVGRAYTAMLVFLAVTGGLWFAGYRERADWLFQSVLLTVLALAAALLLQWAVIGWIRAYTLPADMPRPWYQGWIDLAVRTIVGFAALLVVLEIWSVEVRFLYGMLTSPFVRDVAARLATVLVIALASRFAVTALRYLIYRVFAIGTVAGSTDPILSRRGMTLAPLLTSVVRYSVYFIAVVFILRTIGLDPTPLVAGAGVVGLAVGFGAQSLVKDVITGFFIITEDLISVGDFVELDGRQGQVEEITVRVTKLRLYSGELRIMPNSEIRQIGNRSRGFMRAIVTIPLKPDCDLDHAMRVVQEVSKEYHDRNRDLMLGEPETQGVIELTPEHLTIRAVVKVRPSAHAEVERELRRAVKRALDDRGLAGYSRKTAIAKPAASAEEPSAPAPRPAEPAPVPQFPPPESKEE